VPAGPTFALEGLRVGDVGLSLKRNLRGGRDCMCVCVYDIECVYLSIIHVPGNNTYYYTASHIYNILHYTQRYITTNADHKRIQYTFTHIRTTHSHTYTHSHTHIHIYTRIHTTYTSLASSSSSCRSSYWVSTTAMMSWTTSHCESTMKETQNGMLAYVPVCVCVWVCVSVCECVCERRRKRKGRIN
jgi:hypothetical protein